MCVHFFCLFGFISSVSRLRQRFCVCKEKHVLREYITYFVASKSTFFNGIRLPHSTHTHNYAPAYGRHIVMMPSSSTTLIVSITQVWGISGFKCILYFIHVICTVHYTHEKITQRGVCQMTTTESFQHTNNCLYSITYCVRSNRARDEKIFMRAGGQF